MREVTELLSTFIMQHDSGLRRWLNLPFLYNLLQAAVGANALRRRVIQNHVRAKAGDKVVDIGCGPARILRWLPDVQYLGLGRFCVS